MAFRVNSIMILRSYMIVFLINVISGHVFDEKLFLDNLKENQVIQQLYYPHLNSTLNLINYILHDPNSTIDEQCISDFNRIRSGLLMKEKWALLYYESNGFPKNGRLNGDYNNLGYFDQCLSIGEREMKADSMIETNFCLISVSTPEWNQLIKNKQFNDYFSPLQESTKEILKFNLGKIFGICLPSNCEVKAVVESINRMLMPFGLEAISQKYCTSRSTYSNEPISTTQIIAIITLSCVVIFCICSEFFEDNTFLGHFNLRKNYSRIYDFDANDKKARSTDYLHGLKALMIFCSILLHCFGIEVFQAPFLYSQLRYFNVGNFQVIFDRFYLFADQLFLYGGFFAMFSWYDSIKKADLTAYKYIFTRFLRIFTISVMVILLTFLMPIFSTGPYYMDLMNKCNANCMRNFWKNFLFINNHDDYSEICHLPTWYLSADFQLYLINYFLIHLLVRKPKFGLMLAGLEIFGSSILVILHDYLRNLPYHYQLTTDLKSTTLFEFQQHYRPAFYHANTYVIGIVLAWALKSELKFKFLERKIVQTLVTSIAFTSFLTAMTLPALWERNLVTKNDLVVIIWSVIDKILVSFASSWGFYSIGNNYLTSLRKFFDLRFFIPISQTSASIVMLQFLYFMHMTGTQRRVYTFEISNILKEFVFCSIVTFFFSNITFIFFEMPITNALLKLFNLSRRRDLKFKPSIIDETQYDYTEINNNNPDFKPIKKMN